jgi:hypothetical protein
VGDSSAFGNGFFGAKRSLPLRFVVRRLARDGVRAEAHVPQILVNFAGNLRRL